MKTLTILLLMLSLVLAAGCNKADKTAKPNADKGANSKLAAEPVKFPTILDAARVGDIDDLKRHLARGEAPNSMDGEGYTPLHLTAGGGYRDACALLLDKGADLNVTTKDGLTPLHTASMTGNPETVTLLLDRGAKIEAPDNNQMTPLCTAALKGNIAIAEVLVQRGANVNYMATTQWTPIRVADYGKKPEMIAWLRAHGAKQ